MSRGRRFHSFPSIVTALGAVIGLALVAASCTSPLSPPGGPSADAGEGTVVFVVDGDTVDVDVAGATERVRLIGVDTPETVHPERPAQCFGAEASAHTESLLPPGTRVRLERDAVPRDDYGRLLAYVWRVSDDLLVNLDLVERGFADAVTYGDNEAIHRLLAAAEATARSQGRGLWSVCGAPDVPVDDG